LAVFERMLPRIALMRWNPEPDDVQRSVAQLVLTIVEFLRQLMERRRSGAWSRRR
jgi:hypothetical protein